MTCLSQIGISDSFGLMEKEDKKKKKKRKLPRPPCRCLLLLVVIRLFLAKPRLPKKTAKNHDVASKQCFLAVFFWQNRGFEKKNSSKTMVGPPNRVFSHGFGKIICATDLGTKAVFFRVFFCKIVILKIVLRTMFFRSFLWLNVPFARVAVLALN